MPLTVTPDFPPHADVLQRADAGMGWLAGRAGRPISEANGTTPAWLFGYITGVRSTARDVVALHRAPAPTLTMPVRLSIATQLMFQLAAEKHQRANADAQERLHDQLEQLRRDVLGQGQP